MIKAKTGAISQQVAEVSSARLDKEVTDKRKEGKLDAGQKSMEFLSWTPETYKTKEEFESSLDATGLESLNITMIEPSSIKWGRPFIYTDLADAPLRYIGSAPGHGVIGILALSDLTLPNVGKSVGVSMTGGSVAFYRENDPVEYRSCKGRGILFHISMRS